MTGRDQRHRASRPKPANTYHAVIAFQKVQGLARDSIVGPATWARPSLWVGMPVAIYRS